MYIEDYVKEITLLEDVQIGVCFFKKGAFFVKKENGWILTDTGEYLRFYDNEEKPFPTKELGMFDSEMEIIFKSKTIMK